MHTLKTNTYTNPIMYIKCRLIFQKYDNVFIHADCLTKSSIYNLNIIQFNTWIDFYPIINIYEKQSDEAFFRDG